MALPKLNTQQYELTIPSSDEKIKFRPFLVKEEKILLQGQEGGPGNQGQSRARQNCVCFALCFCAPQIGGKMTRALPRPSSAARRSRRSVPTRRRRVATQRRNISAWSASRSIARSPSDRRKVWRSRRTSTRKRTQASSRNRRKRNENAAKPTTPSVPYGRPRAANRLGRPRAANPRRWGLLVGFAFGKHTHA